MVPLVQFINPLYKTDPKPPGLPIVVLVNFDTHTNPPFLSNLPNCVPIYFPFCLDGNLLVEDYPANNYLCNFVMQ